MVSTASRVGTGNIVGVATAVTLGGPGALFWMEVAAFLGIATKYTWSSSDPAVATVSAGGVVRGRRKGTVTITVTTDNGKQARVKVTVK